MEDIALQNIWKEYDRKLEESKVLNLQSWALNRQAFEMMQTQKAKSKLNRLATFKTRAVALGIVWAAFLCFLVFYKISWQGIFFNASAGMIALFTTLAIVTYIKHIVLIRQIDESGSIVETQQKLADLQSSTIRTVGILWLQMPFYTTFFLTPATFVNGGVIMWIITITITGLFTFVAIWLYKNINYTNRHKKWFKILFGSIEWTAVVKAIEYLDEVEKFRKED
jgi:MFS family permease